MSYSELNNNFFFIYFYLNLINLSKKKILYLNLYFLNIHLEKILK